MEKMTFYEVIEGLYSGSEYRICAILNKGKHVCNAENGKFLVIHTGFCCRVQTNNIFEVLYGVRDNKIYYQKQKCSIISPMGLPIIIDTNGLPFKREFFGENEWYDQYNLDYDSFHVVLVKDVTVENDKASSLILADKENTAISQFSISEKGEVVEKYPLCIKNIPFLYLSYSGFSPYRKSSLNNNFGWSDDYGRSWNDNYGKSCEKYNGYNGWGDDLIDDVFGGIPEATWNVD